MDALIKDFTRLLTSNKTSVVLLRLESKLKEAEIEALKKDVGASVKARKEGNQIYLKEKHSNLQDHEIHNLYCSSIALAEQRKLNYLSTGTIANIHDYVHFRKPFPEFFCPI